MFLLLICKIKINLLKIFVFFKHCLSIEFANNFVFLAVPLNTSRLL